ncbi:LuxR C-terminal-related transcriptional regulator [Parvibaculum sp.]|uniref:LuxR C-terminal-related transcriptional regulator n=1 Tax=Parvibaculum sp. TaxID=2024848 RepID=UPI003BAC144B
MKTDRKAKSKTTVMTCQALLNRTNPLQFFDPSLHSPLELKLTGKSLIGSKVVNATDTVELLPVSAAVLDDNGEIVGVNSAWKEFGRRNGLCLKHYGVGTSYLKHCGKRGAGQSIADDLRQLLEGKRDLVMHIYPCDSPRKKRWFMMLALPLSPTLRSGIAISHTELSSLLPKYNPQDQETRHKSVTSAFAQAVVNSVAQALALQLQSMLGLTEPRRAPTAQVRAEPPPPAGLSKRQLEVLRLIGKGKTNAEIAQSLSRSPHTVKLHVSAILRELNVKSRTQAALIASELFSGNAEVPQKIVKAKRSMV